MLDPKLRLHIIAKPDQCLGGPCGVVRTLSHVLNNPPQVEETRPYRVRVLITLVALQ